MLLRKHVLLNKKDDGDGGGGAGDNKPDLAKQVADLTAQNAKIMEALTKLTAAPSDKKEDKKDDEDLGEKARKERELADKNAASQKDLEAALTFDLKSEEFLKANAPLLPKDIADIFKTAKSEKYDNAVDKANALKAAVIGSFFKVQSNLDLLTAGLKNKLEDYLKLTNTGKQEKAAEIYDSVFEPALSMLKQIKKADALAKGHGVGTSTDDGYKNKLVTRSKKHFLGEKSNGT